MTERSGFHHTTLRVKDLNATIAFYEALGCSVVLNWAKDVGPCCMMDMGGGNRLEIFSGRTDGEEAFSRFEHIALKSSDPDADFAAALAAGGRPRMEPTDINIGGNFPARIAFVYGPDDEVIEFFKER